MYIVQDIVLKKLLFIFSSQRHLNNIISTIKYLCFFLFYSSTWSFPYLLIMIWFL